MIQQNFYCSSTPPWENEGNWIEVTFRNKAGKPRATYDF